MKSFVLIILSFMVMGISSCKSQDSRSGSDAESGAVKSTLEVIAERTSIRRYTDQKLTDQQLETLVRAGMAAPSATNAQPWLFIVVNEEGLLKEIGESLKTSRMAMAAPAAILVCGDLHKAKEGWMQEYWIQDCSAASENILIAATSMGLGAVWTSIYPAQERIDKIAAILNLPEHIIPLNVIPVGYPDELKEPMDKWKPENLKWNKWD